jgi:hypothetical protein
MAFGVTLFASRGVTHDYLLLARAKSSRRGRYAWVPYHTLE